MPQPGIAFRTPPLSNERQPKKAFAILGAKAFSLSHSTSDLCH